MTATARTTLVTVALAAVLGLAACSTDEGDEGALPTTTSTAAPAETTTVEPAAPASVDWAARTAEVDAPGWEVAFCEGDAPLLCVARGGDSVGVVEHVSFPATSIAVMAPALADGDERAALAAFAADFVASFATDRAEGCGEAYEVRGDDAVDAVVGGGDGIRYGFTGSVDGRTVEHAVGFADVRDGQLHLVTASGLADDGCLSRGSELDVEGLGAFLPHLAAIAAGSSFPTVGP